jgi:hypothetical protein
MNSKAAPMPSRRCHLGSPDRVMVLSFFPVTASTNATAQIGQMVSILNFALGVPDL